MAYDSAQWMLLVLRGCLVGGVAGRFHHEYVWNNTHTPVLLPHGSIRIEILAAPGAHLGR
eukprot:scaffold211837_cov79-Attheya_sp.AAC.1